MRITKANAAENKARVLDEAGRLFRARGFESTGVADVMHAAGLTHGGFYNHFKSKDDLEAQACARIFEAAVARVANVADAPPAERLPRLLDYVRSYLSTRARDADGARCPMVAFGADVSRQSANVQAAYAEGLARYLEALARAIAQTRDAEPTIAPFLAIDMLTRLVGALTLARSVAKSDPALSNQILARTLEQVMEEAKAHAPL